MKTDGMRDLMERPVKEILESGKPDFPFMLCWANENWNRAWDGSNDKKKVLIEQHYSEEDDRKHIKYLCENVFKDPRYIRINGRPVFAIYRIGPIPDPERTFHVMRDEARKYGEELYLCQSFWALHNSTPELYKEFLIHTLTHFAPYSDEENFVFINAWNEWAEGNHLEPDQRWGRGYLEATKQAIDSISK